MKREHWVGFFVCGLLALILSAGELRAQPSAAGMIRAARVSGEVTAVNVATQEETAVANGSLLSQGQAVRTGEGARVILLFSNGSSVSVSENSSLSIDSFLQDPFSGAVDELETEPTRSITRLNLSYGEMVGDVKTLNERSEYRIQTPVGAAGIRGTAFLISFNPQTGALRLSMENGVVVFTSIAPVDQAGAPPGEVEVTAGQEVNLSATVNAQGQVTQVQVTTGAVAQETRDAIVQAVEQAVQELRAQPTFTPSAETQQQQDQAQTEERRDEEAAQQETAQQQQQEQSSTTGQSQSGHGGNSFPAQPIDRSIGVSPSS